MQSEESDSVMAKLREVEDLASSSDQWVHYKLYIDVKTTFNDALAICEELREHAELCKHAETRELPSYSKEYIVGKIYSIVKAMGLEVEIQEPKEE